VHGLESITKATTKAATNKIITITIQAAGAAETTTRNQVGIVVVYTAVESAFSKFDIAFYISFPLHPFST